MNSDSKHTITEGIVRDRLLSIYRPSKEMVAFNIGAIGNHKHEVDFIRVLKSGYVEEYEIKISRADIRAEIKKKTRKHDELIAGVERHVGWYQGLSRRFHTWYAVDDPNLVGPVYDLAHSTMSRISIVARYRHPIRRYIVAVPLESGIADFAVEMFPPWVGIVELSARNTRGLASLRIVREPTVLSVSRKLIDAEIAHIHRAMGFKFWNLYFKYGSAGRK